MREFRGQEVDGAKHAGFTYGNSDGGEGVFGGGRREHCALILKLK